MSEIEISDETRAAIGAAYNMIREGMQAYLDAISDAGEPEIVESALVMFEAKGMADHGIFVRRTWLPIEMGSVSAMLGMFELLSDDVQHTLRCRGNDHG